MNDYDEITDPEAYEAARDDDDAALQALAQRLQQAPPDRQAATVAWLLLALDPRATGDRDDQGYRNLLLSISGDIHSRLEAGEWL